MNSNLSLLRSSEDECNYFYGITLASMDLVFNEYINNADIPVSMPGEIVPEI